MNDAKELKVTLEIDDAIIKQTILVTRVEIARYILEGTGFVVVDTRDGQVDSK